MGVHWDGFRSTCTTLEFTERVPNMDKASLWRQLIMQAYDVGFRVWEIKRRCHDAQKMQFLSYDFLKYITGNTNVLYILYINLCIIYAKHNGSWIHTLFNDQIATSYGHWGHASLTMVKNCPYKTGYVSQCIQKSKVSIEQCCPTFDHMQLPPPLLKSRPQLLKSLSLLQSPMCCPIQVGIRGKGASKKVNVTKWPMTNDL